MGSVWLGPLALQLAVASPSAAAVKHGVCLQTPCLLMKCVCSVSCSVQRQRAGTAPSTTS